MGTRPPAPYWQEFDVETCPFHASPDMDGPELRAATDQAKLIAADEQGF